MALIGSVAWRAPNCAYAAGAVHEGAGKPRGQNAAGARHELQTFPKKPCERASYGFYAEDDVDIMGGFETGVEITELGRSHPVSCAVVPEFLDNDFASNWSWSSAALQ